jgi:hypothetical protein
MIWQNESWEQPSTMKSVGYLILPTSTSTSVTIPRGDMYSLLSSW